LSVRALLYTSPARGHLYPAVPIARELLARGHAVAAVVLEQELSLIQGLGAEARAIDPAVSGIEMDDWRGSSALARGRRALLAFAARARREAPDLERAISAHDPDVLLIDVNCWGAATVAEASGRPWAMYSPYLLPLPSRDAPPYGLGLTPARGPLGAVRDALARQLMRGGFDLTAMPSINRLRAAQGLPTLKRYSEVLGRPRRLITLTSEGFEYPRGDWPANVLLVGPLAWAPLSEEPPWLAELGDPLVLVTCSTERQRDARLITIALEALPETGAAVIATSAAHDSAGFPAPPGSKVVRFLAHEHVLRRAACVVCHGGMGITQKALAAGVPVVVVPFGRDQLETARRVEVAEAGVRLPTRRLSAPRLREAVARAIELRPGAERVAAAFAQAGGERAAADALEQIAADRPTQAATGTSPPSPTA
jgi:MGT family glycosyltransferase